MKTCVTLVLVCLVACAGPTMGDDMMSGGPGSGMGPGDEPTGDPRDDPFLADINNSWNGSQEGIGYGFNFAARPSGKISSAVVRGNMSLSPGGPFQLDGIFYDHMVHVIAIQNGDVRTFDGAFIDVQTMHLVNEDSQAHIILGCSAPGGCM